MENKDNKIFDLLVTALEGGSNYWYLLSNEACGIINKYREKDETTVESLYKALLAGEAIPIHDVEDIEEKLGVITKAKLETAIETLLKTHPAAYSDIAEETMDAETADIWFQIACMGEVVFG